MGSVQSLPPANTALPLAVSWNGTFRLNPSYVFMTDFSVRPPKSLTPEEKRARDAARRADAAQAMLEYEAAQIAFRLNRERLKAERLARKADLAREQGP
jgi:hypothetical protein